MTWIKLDDTLPNNPKILPLSDKAFRVYIEGLCYANQYLTDGALTNPVITRLGGNESREELVCAGLWDETEDGIQIHDYTQHQSSRRDVQEKRDQVRNRVTRFREKSNADVTLPEYRIQNTETDTETDFDKFWSVYPRKAGKRDAEKAFAKALTLIDLETLLEAATKYRDDPNRIDTFTAHPATWLNQGRWSDAPLPPRNAPQGGFKPILTPTPIPPRFSQDDIPTGSPMPDFVRNLFPKIPDL